MTKLALYVFVPVIALVSFAHTSHAAFSFQNLSTIGDGKIFYETGSPSFSQYSYTVDGQQVAGYGGQTNISSNTKNACDTAVAASGVSSTQDIYCAYEKLDQVITPAPSMPVLWICPLSGCGGGGGGGASSTQSTAPYRQISTVVSIYEAPLQQTTYSQYQADEDTYESEFQAWINGGAQGTAPQRPNIACWGANYAYHGGQTYYGTVNSSDETCDIYKHTGVADEVEIAGSCSVSPTTIATGGSATWTATASGGNGSYGYVWSGTDSLSGTGASVAKTYAAPGAKSASVTITSGTQSKTVACSNLVTVQPPTQPNLSATIGSAVSGTAGQGVALAGTIHNTGDSAAPAGFNDLFIVYQADQATEHGSVSVSANPAIGPGSSASRSASYTFPAAGTYYYHLCADWNGSVAESNEADNCSALQSVTISSLAADLTAGAVSPTVATVGAPTTFSATATNISGGTSGSFPMLFQIENGSLFASGYLAGLAQGASGTGSASHTFSSAGTYQVRACANFNTSWTAIATESNYSNNCGPWTTVTVTPDTAPAPTCSLTTSGSGVPSTLTWSSTNAASCTGGGFSTGGATSGSATASVTGNYLLSCTGAGGSCQASATVSDGACSGTPVLDITAVPNRVRAGQTSTVSWTASNVSSGSCTVSGPGVSQTIPAAAAPQCTIPNGSATPVISTQSTYTITCGATSESVTVNVIPQYQEF